MRTHWYIPAAVVLVLALVGFFAGWLQLSLGPDLWGVVSTRRKGFEAAPVDPAGFTWRWQRLLPRALTLYRIPITTQRAELNAEAALPSADAYASLLPERPDLSVEMKITVLYRIHPEALPRLVRVDGLRAENVASWYGQIQSEIQQQAADIAVQAIGSGATAQAFDPAGLGERVARLLPDRFPELQIVSASAQVLRMPDPALYAKLRQGYLRLVDQRQAALSAMAPRLAAQQAAAMSSVQRQDASIAALSRYGELLNKYPSLIRLLFIAKAGKLTAQDLQTLDLLEKLPLTE